jgi:transcriptional regulator with XRE-family HTH domain
METRDKGAKLGQVIRQAREAKGLSTRKLAEAIGTTHSYIHKLEAGWFGSISPENIQSLAKALEVDPQDLFALAGYKVPEGLPTLVPYMRTKYGEDLPDEAIEELQSYFGYLRAKYGSGGGRPIGDEDEDNPDEARASHGGQR